LGDNWWGASEKTRIGPLKKKAKRGKRLSPCVTGKTNRVKSSSKFRGLGGRANREITTSE